MQKSIRGGLVLNGSHCWFAQVQRFALRMFTDFDMCILWGTWDFNLLFLQSRWISSELLNCSYKISSNGFLPSTHISKVNMYMYFRRYWKVSYLYGGKCYSNHLELTNWKDQEYHKSRKLLCRTHYKNFVRILFIWGKYIALLSRWVVFTFP